MVNSLWYSFLGILASAALTSGQYNHQPDYNQYNNQQQQQPQQHHQQQQQYYPTNQYDKNQYNPKNTNNNLQYNNQQQYNNAYNREVDFTPKQSPPGNTNVCYQAPDDGYCSDKVSIRFFFDSKKLTCTDFEYRGCPGTGNNFLSRMDCLHTCLLRQADGPIDPERDIEMRMDMAGNSFPGPVRNFLPPPPPPHTNMERSPPQHMEMPPPPHRFHGESQMNIGPQGRSYRPVQRYHGAREMPRWMTVRRMEEGNAPMSMRENHFPEPDFGLGNEFQHSEESLPIEEIGGEMKPAIRLAPVCLERLDTGPCKAMIPRWYYNHDQHQCLPLYYGGCKGNNNNFATREDCMHICGVQRSTTEQMTSQPSTEVPLIDNNEENKEPVSVDNVAPAEPKFLKPETTTEPPKGDASGEPEGIETESLWPTFLQMLTQGIFKKGPLPKGVTVVPQTTDEGEHTRASTSESPKESVTTDSPMVESDEESDTPVIESDDEEYRPILGEDIPGEEGRPEYIGDMEESPDSIGDADYANEEDDVDVPNSEDRRVLRTREMEPKGIFTTMSTPRDEEDKPFVWPVIRVYLNKKQLQKKYFSIPRPLFKMGREEEREAPEQMKYNRNSFPMFRKGRKNFNKQKNNKGITLMQFFVHKNRFGQQPYRRPTFFHPPMSLYQRRPYSWRMERPTAHVPFIQERYGMFGAQSHRPTFREVLSPLARPTFNFGLPIMPRAQISIQKIVEIKPHINQGYGQEPKLAFPGIVQAAGERDMADTPQATVKYGEPNLACLIPKEVGYCPGQFPQPKWYFNLNKHRCEIFFYGGCGGNLNRFNSYDECKATCLVTTPNPRFGMETTGPATMSLSASSTVYSSSPSTELDRAATSSTDAPWTTTTEQAVAETTEQVPGMIEEVSDEATLPSRVEVIEKIRTGVKEEVTLTEEEASRPIKHEEVRISRLHIDGAVEFGTIIAILVLGAIALLILLVLCGIYVARKYKKREKKEKTKKETIVEAVLRAHMFGTFPSLPIKEPPPPSPPSSTV